MYDLVLFGATGVTGALTAGYLAGNVPSDCRWALAGRSAAGLEALRRRLAGTDPRLSGLPLLHADAADPESLRSIAENTRVVVTTVGPYTRHGGPLVEACARAGTDYLDLCGESEFVDETYLRHHATAAANGARLVHSCGFDSVPYDLGVYFTVGQLPEGVPLRIDGFVRASGALSGGTFHSVVTALSRAGATARAARRRRRIEETPRKRRARAVLGRPHLARSVGMWAVPLPTLDPVVVARSAAALDRYGPDFAYRNFAAVRHLPVAVGGAVGAGVLFAAAQVPPVRGVLLGLVKQGRGPSRARREKSWFTMLFVAEGGGRRVITEVSGGDPGYGETSKMLAESALCLAFDDLPRTAGQVTPAAAMGQALVDRLMAAGITFRVLRSG